MRVKLLLVVILIPFFISKSYANSNRTITWLLNEDPPFSRVEGQSLPDSSICNLMTQQVIDALPNYQHTTLLLPQNRISKYLDEGMPACFSCMIHRSQSTSRVQYSIPTTIYPSFVVLANEQQAEEITQQHGDPVSLISLFTDKRFIFGQTSGRKFGDEIDNIIENTKLSERILYNSNGLNASLTTLLQLKHGFIDYTIDYPFVANFYNEKAQIKLKTITIGSPKLAPILGAIGCSASADDEFAQRAIEDINHVLRSQILFSDHYISGQRKLLEPSYPEFVADYNQYVLSEIEN